MTVLKQQEKCRICSGTNFEHFLDLGFSPPADQFLKAEHLKEPETSYPLTVQICKECNLVQLGQVVHHEILYRNDYPYESSTTKQGKLHWEEFATLLSRNMGLNSEDLVVDIGSNVGVLLEVLEIVAPKFSVLIQLPILLILQTIEGLRLGMLFLILKQRKKILSQKGSAKIITGTNVFAHIDDLNPLCKRFKSSCVRMEFLFSKHLIWEI